MGRSLACGEPLRGAPSQIKKTSVAGDRAKSRGEPLPRLWVRYRQPKMALAPERLVFLDETSVTPPLTPLGGRSLKGVRVQGTAPFGGRTTQTFIAGLSNTGLGAPWLISAAMEGPAFTKYSAEVLAPEVEPGTLVLPDNFSPHKLKPAQMASEEAGGWVLFLPPYRRDLPPMEMAFAKLMNHLTSGGPTLHRRLRCPRSSLSYTAIINASTPSDMLDTHQLHCILL